MSYKHYVGIDIGKTNNAVYLHPLGESLEIKNDPCGFVKLLKWIESKTGSAEPVLFAFEHTGLYSYRLSVFLSEKELPFVMLPGLAIKRSLGITRGKEDGLDARNIAIFAYRRREELKSYKMPDKNIRDIKSLLGLRDKLVSQRAGYKATLGEYEAILNRKENKTLFSVQEEMVKQLSKQIEKIEKDLDDIIRKDDEIQRLFAQITSIKGVGDQTALYMIAATNGFTMFDNWRKFASYCGTAPFPHTSGTSIRGKTRVSNLANKKIKSLLHLCALSAIKNNQELSQYYQRRIEEGKSRMSTINVVRNKLLARIFAVIKRDTPYVELIL